MSSSCLICLSTNETNGFVDVCSDSCDLTAIIGQYFHWILQPNPDVPADRQLCQNCWNSIRQFHEFYKRVEAIHSHYNNGDGILEPSRPSRSDGGIEDTIAAESNVKSECCEDYQMAAEMDVSEQTCFIKIEAIYGDAKSKTASDDNGDSPSLDDDDEQNICVRKRKTRDLRLTQKERSQRRQRQRESDEQQINDFFAMTCDLCNIGNLMSYHRLSEHYRNEHGLKNGYVHCCKKKFDRLRTLLAHMKWHMDPNSLRCPVCKKVYLHQQTLKLHMEQVHAPAELCTLICDICGEKFASKSTIKLHFRNRHMPIERIHECSHCEKSFLYRHALTNHVHYMHSDTVESPICFICAKVFRSQSSCDIHVRQQHGDQSTRAQCNICHVWLASKKNLKSHINRVHCSEPQVCQKCGKVSPTMGALKAHMRFMHSDQPRLRCTLCTKSFKSAITLREHMAAHTGVHLYTCSYCPRTFASNANMYAHRKKAHLNEWNADREREVLLVGNDQNHRKSHPSSIE